MALEILIRSTAEDDAEKAILYINQHNQEAAKQFALSLRKIVNHLAVFPSMGHVCGYKIQAYRFLLRDYNYWVLYTFSDTQLEVLRIVHTSQDFDS